MRAEEGTQFSVVRYGNVFGSRGSVIPFFKECAKKGEIPITDMDMTRFWITLEQGVDFVLHCIEEMHGGEIFIPKIPSMKVIDLAKVIGPKCKYKAIGIRPGEKLHESLISANNGLDTYELSDKYVIYSKIVPTRNQKVRGKNLGASFKGYNSHENKSWVTIDQLKKMIDSSIA